MLHQVGVGALGPVFRTYEPTRDRLVAVKVFRLDITPEQAQSLADELSVAADAGLFHPSIVEPIAAGVEGASAYRADEYVAAETLDVAMRHYAPASAEKILPFITQLAGAIDFARTAGVGHGALHPRDIFVTPDEARAGGFGIVEALERVGLRAPVRRPYTAPERIAGGKWGIAADVFSLAVIAYELLTGRRPSGTGPQIAAITGGEHAPAIHAVIVRAMSEDPERRHASALAFASELDAASRGEALPAAAGVAAAASASVDEAPEEAPEDVEELVAAMPPQADVDERAEPAIAEQEETDFRASEPEFDDILAERDEDVAHAALSREEEQYAELGTDTLAHASLFDEEAIEDLAIDQGPQRDTERFADAFVVASAPDSEPPATQPSRGPAARPLPARDEAAEDAGAAYAGVPFSSYSDSPGVLSDTRGVGVVPWAVTIALALLVGFAAGYSVRGRVPVSTEPAAGAATATKSAPAPPEKPASQPYSEQAVTPSDPPPPAGDAPLTSRDLRTIPEPAAAPKPPAPPTTGSVEVRSSPSGAGVTIDGTWRGRTPLTVDKVRFGRHTIRVVQPGYVTAREEVTLSARAPSRELSLKLQRTPASPPPQAASRASQPASQSFTGTIYVDSRPRGAQVLLDGKVMGTTPVLIPDVRVGSHVVRLQLRDHSDWTTSTRVSSGQEARVTGSLERIR